VNGQLLFDQFDRSDSRPAQDGETSIDFLQRRAGPFWDRVRDHLESSYAAFPDEHKHGFKTRFLDGDGGRRGDTGLEHARLLTRSFGGNGPYLGLTRLGMHAVRTNTVRQHLGLGDASPA
jgi:hypothetical protein